MRVVVLDSSVNDSMTVWALWTLVHLRHPLTWLYNAAEVMEEAQGGANVSWKLILHNDSLVDLYDPVSRGIFVLPSDTLENESMGNLT